MAGESILIVDDNPLNLKLARVVLQSEGFEVFAAESVPEAREAIARVRPRLILMDIQLPGLDGLAFTRELKASPSTESIVVVALTSYAMRGDRERALASGCQGYLSKPIDTRTFGQTVTSFLRESPP